VQVLERAGDSVRDVEGLVPREGLSGADPLVEGLTIDEVHDQEVPLVAHPSVQDLHHPRVVQAGQDLHLPQEARERGGGLEAGLQDGLDGHHAAAVRVDPPVHPPHPALADQARDDVLPDGLGELRALLAPLLDSLSGDVAQRGLATSLT
jgi:hypothetical protein